MMVPNSRRTEPAAAFAIPAVAGARKRHVCESRRRGAAAVEFAISIAVLLLIIFASIEFVRLNMMRHSVDHATYLAARRGIIIGAEVEQVKQVAEDHLTLFGINDATITVSPDPLDDSADTIEIAIDVPVAGNSWISPLYFGGTMNGRTRMLAERASAKMSAATASVQ